MTTKKTNVTPINTASHKAKTASHGGKRVGAGRPKGTGKYGEPTTAIRVPTKWVGPIQALLKRKKEEKASVNLCEVETIWSPSPQSKTAIPMFTNKVAAGFPSPADDHIESSLDLNEYLIQHPAATFYLRVTGESMLGAGIRPDDILIVDRAVEATNGKIVIAALNGELTVKRLKKQGDKVYLMPANEAFKPIEIKPEMEFHIWGVVTSVIHQF